MQELLLIGIGTGNPDHITGEARRAMRCADAILIPQKGPGKEDLADLRLQICDAILGADTARIVTFDLPVRDERVGYVAGVAAWHDAIAEAWQHAAPPDLQTVALLIWGDPSLYDSSLRIAARLHPAPRIRVIPGITSLQAMTAAHAIPLNAVGRPVQITTGRRLREDGWPDGMDRIAVMLDGDCAFRTLTDQDRYTIWWGAYVGMPNQLLFAGPLSQVSDQIVAARSETRKAHGWIMDIYVLERRG